MEFLQQILRPEERLTMTLRSLYESRGYKKYKMSQFEEYRLYMENKNFLASEAVLTFTDLDGRLMALKPDVTLSIVKQAPGGQGEKLYYLESVYRPGAAARSFREISQMGLERLGRIDDFAISETVFLAAQSLAAVSDESILAVSHLGFVPGLLAAAGVSEAKRPEFLKYISEKNAHQLRSAAKAEGIAEENIRRMEEAAGLSGELSDALQKARELCISPEMEQAADALSHLAAALKAQECSCPVQLDLSLLADPDYYNGIVFGGYISGLPDKVLAGGQYDQLPARMGKGGGAIGFALYLTDLELLFAPAQKRCDILLRYTEKADPAEVCRWVARQNRAGLRVCACPEQEQLQGILPDKTLLFDENGVKEVAGC